MNKRKQWLSLRDKGFVWSLEKTRFGAMLNFKIESWVLHIIVEKVNKLLVCHQHDCNAEIYKETTRVIIK